MRIWHKKTGLSNNGVRNSYHTPMLWLINFEIMVMKYIGKFSTFYISYSCWWHKWLQLKTSLYHAMLNIWFTIAISMFPQLLWIWTGRIKTCLYYILHCSLRVYGLPCGWSVGNIFLNNAWLCNISVHCLPPENELVY